MQQSTLTYPVNQTVLVEGECSTTIPHKGFGNKNKSGNLEYPNQQKYGAIANGVGEIPLNGKGKLSAHNGGDEEIVYSHMKV